MTSINIQNIINILAQGEKSSKHCKSVLCYPVDGNGEIMCFTSIEDAASKIGTNKNYISNRMSAGKPCRGLRFVPLERAVEYLPEIIAMCNRNDEDARKYREYQAEQEEIRKAEEKRQAEIEKIRARVERYTEVRNKDYRKYLESEGKLAEAEHLLAELTGETIHVVA